MRAVPEAGRVHRGAVLDMPVMHRRQPLGPEVAVAFGGQRADRDRREGRAEARRADLGDRFAERFGHDGEARHVGGLALVGRHAERGVALQVLDRDETLAMRQTHVLGGHVVLKVDEGLALGRDFENRRGLREWRGAADLRRSNWTGIGRRWRAVLPKVPRRALRPWRSCR